MKVCDNDICILEYEKNPNNSDIKAYLNDKIVAQCKTSYFNNDSDTKELNNIDSFVLKITNNSAYKYICIEDLKTFENDYKRDFIFRRYLLNNLLDLLEESKYACIYLITGDSNIEQKYNSEYINFLESLGFVNIGAVDINNTSCIFLYIKDIIDRNIIRSISNKIIERKIIL